MKQFVNKNKIKEAFIKENPATFSLHLVMGFTSDGKPIITEIEQITETMCMQKSLDLGLVQL